MNQNEGQEWIRAAVETYQGRLIRYARLITGDAETARDAVQETFLRLCRENPRRIQDHLAAWLFRVCRHRALDARRKEDRMVSIDQSPQGIPASGGVGVDGLDRRLDERQEYGRVLAALTELTPLQQEVLRLRFQEELSYREISSVTGRSLSHVGVLIHDGMKGLRRKLDGRSSPAQEGGR
jgi:RNA polymerase sigma factor (sigma-70 family)